MSRAGGHAKRDPKTLTGLAKRSGAVSHIAKSFENAEKGSARAKDPPQAGWAELARRDAAMDALGGSGFLLNRSVPGANSARSSMRQQPPPVPQRPQQNPQRAQQQQHHHHHHGHEHRPLPQQAHSNKQTLVRVHQPQRGGHRDSYREPRDALHLPRPTFSPRPVDDDGDDDDNDHEGYNEPRDERDPDPSPLKARVNSQGRLYFGSSIRINNGAFEKQSNISSANNLMNATPKLVRGPTLGELLHRGDVVTSSSRSYGIPNPRDPDVSQRFLQRQADGGDASTHDVPRSRSFSEQNLTPSRKSTANISQLNAKGLNNELGVPARARPVVGKPPTPVPQRSTRIVNSRRQSFRQTNISREGRNSVRNNNQQSTTQNGSIRNIPDAVNRNINHPEHTYDLDVVENGNSCSLSRPNENGKPKSSKNTGF
ncbi:putative uncharacterized protein DDB_G0279653 [Penaeus japonicus]|uniref:putative uncharacterized protein DDB_G0279653 n=1 Tax=Penaeus japonicus TaxID=27405 RepID=UPI001C70C42C|nr:putative uncharacterized protein DDB_G0279653 [Penaeus japonicus]